MTLSVKNSNGFLLSSEGEAAVLWQTCRNICHDNSPSIWAARIHSEAGIVGDATADLQQRAPGCRRKTNPSPAKHDTVIFPNIHKLMKTKGARFSALMGVFLVVVA